MVGSSERFWKGYFCNEVEVGDIVKSKNTIRVLLFCVMVERF